MTKSKLMQMAAFGSGLGDEGDIMRRCANGRTCNVLELIEAFEDNDCQYLVTKFMQGGDLLNYLVKQKR